MILAFHIKAINFHNLERFTVRFNPGIPISKLLIFINSKNLRTERKLIVHENFQDYSMNLNSMRGWRLWRHHFAGPITLPQLPQPELEETRLT